MATRASQFYTAEFSIRQNVRGYMLPTWWSYMLHKYGAYSGPFRLPAVGCTAVMEAPIDWGSMEALPATSERCESLVTSQPDRQVARPFRNARFSDVECRYSVSCSNRSLDRPDHIHRRHRRVSRTRAGRPVPVFGMKASGGRTMTSMAMAMVLAAPLEAAVACTRKVNNVFLLV